MKNCLVCGGDLWRKAFSMKGYDFIKCSTCGLMRLSPMPSRDDLAKHYAKRFGTGNFNTDNAAERLPYTRFMFEFVKKHAPSGPIKIFDIGCFDGLLLDMAQDEGWETWGLEYQGQAAEITAKKHRGRVVYGDVESYLPDQPNIYDIVCATGVIEHLLDPIDLLALSKKLIKPGGLLILQTPDTSSITAKIMGRYWPCYAAPEHTHYFNRVNLERLLSAGGFDPLGWKPHWKTLRLGYLFDQMQYFGSELRASLDAMVRRMPGFLLDMRFPFYAGEIIFAFQAPDNLTDSG